jgi:hypothetical protein
VQEAREKTERDNKAKRVCLENRKRLYRELIEFKERNEAEERKKAEEREKNKAGDGMMLATPADLSAINKARQINAENAKNRVEGFKPLRARSSKVPAMPRPKPNTPVNLSRQVRNEEAMRKYGKLGKTGEVAVSGVLFALFVFSDLSSRLSVATCVCVSREDLCVYGSRTACLTCNQRKVRCLFLDAKRKHKDAEIDSEEDEEPTPKKPRGGAYKPSAVKPTVEISGPSLAASGLPVVDMVGLLWELVEGVRELTKVTRGVAGLGTQIYQQNVKLVRLGERQSYLAEKALKGSGSGSEAGESVIREVRKDKGKGKAEVTKEDETMRSDRGSEEDLEEGSEKDMREDSDVGGSGMDSDTEK